MPSTSRSFFYPRPVVFDPAEDPFLVSLPGAAFGLLRTPAEPAKQAANVINVIPHAELGTDQIDDPGAGPEVSGKPGGRRALQEQLLKTGSVVVIKLAGTSGDGLSRESINAIGEVSSLPAMDGPAVNTQLCGNLRRGMTLSK